MITEGLKMRMATENEKLKIAELLISEYGTNVSLEIRREVLKDVSESNVVAYDLKDIEEFKTILVQMAIGYSTNIEGERELQKITEEYLIDEDDNICGYVSDSYAGGVLTTSVTDVDSLSIKKTQKV